VLHKTFATSRRRASPLPDRGPATKLYLLRVAEYARHVGPKDSGSFRLLATQRPPHRP
jgi:hypothetical protein